MKTKSASQTAPTPSWKNAILLAITALALSASPTVALAADCFRVTSWADTTGSWFVAANWLNGQPPTVAIGAQINNGGTAQVNGPEARAKVSHRTLTFIERVAYQRAIEEVYWRHRIWPKERPDPKPSLEAVMSQAQLEKKVNDYLRKSQALEDYWQRPLTAEQLQAEMDRMAQHTKQPEVLKELFDALGNDPFVIAECLARPALAERLLTHGALEQLKRTSQTYNRIVPATATFILPIISDTPFGCLDDSWAATSSTNAPTGRFDQTAVWTGTEMIV